MDYALIVSLALYGGYIAVLTGLPRRNDLGFRVILSLLVAISIYAALKYVFIATGIQSP